MAETKVQTAIEDFDWEAYENGETAGSKNRQELTNTYDESLKTAKENEVVTGTVKSISKREVRVDIGMKSDAIIPVSEFRYNPDLKVGDEVEVYIETLEDKNGQLRLSHKKACQTRSWDRVNEALEKDEIIKGYVKSRTKGGMIVDVFGIDCAGCEGYKCRGNVDVVECATHGVLATDGRKTECQLHFKCTEKGSQWFSPRFGGMHALEIFLERESETMEIGTCSRSLCQGFNNGVCSAVEWAPAADIGIESECHYGGGVGVMAANRKLLHACLCLCALCCSAEWHQHGGCTNRRVEHLDQTFLRSDILILQVVEEFLFKVVAYDFACEGISVLDSSYMGFCVVASTGRVDKLSLEICHEFTVVIHPHSAGISDVSHVAHFDILLMAVTLEFLAVFGFYNH